MPTRRRFLSQVGRLGAGALAFRNPLAAPLAPRGRSVAAHAAHPSATVPVRYTDVAHAAGIDFVQDATATDRKYYLETMGTGVGWIDFDQNGFMDLFFVQSSATDAYKPPRPLRCALYRNNGDGTFSDVTGKAGVGAAGLYGQGVAVGDFDNDGFPDLYVTGYTRSILFRNNGDGTFTDVTAKAGVANSGGWGTSAGWFDYDRDGYLDLLVCNYIDWSPQNNLWCGDHKPGYRAYCHPDDYKGQHLRLYHNNHDGTFTDVSRKSGIGIAEVKGMGAVLADFNGDGWPDVAVANDTWPNSLFLNQRDGTFKDVSFVSGVAASEDGEYEAGMGIDAADVDGDGWPDLYITHLDHELNRLYHNNRDGSFDDATYASGFGNTVMNLSGVTMKFLDYDNDGWTDICQVNGAMLDNIGLYHPEVSYQEPCLMFRNLGGGKFINVSGDLGPDFVRPIAGRGLAVADYDNDGDLDLAINVRGGRAALLRNDGGNAHNWLEVFLIGTRSNCDAVGASLKLVSEGFVQVKQRQGGMGYMSASDPRLHFGLGTRKTIDFLEITWPNGSVEKLEKAPVNRIITVKEGEGIVPRPFPRVAAR